MIPFRTDDHFVCVININHFKSIMIKENIYNKALIKNNIKLKRKIPCIDIDNEITINVSKNKAQTLLNCSDWKCACCGAIAKCALVYKNPLTDNGTYIIDVLVEKDDNFSILTCDHIIPKSLGGEDNINNYQLLCYNCNIEKGNKLE